MKKVKYVPSDIIGGMFFYFYYESPDSPFFIGDQKKIHETLFELRKSYSILKVFPFSENEFFPFSQVLEKSLSILQLARVIRMEDDFARFVISNVQLEKIIRIFDEGQKEQLREIAIKFREECGCD